MGDPIVELAHLKQPAAEVGPWKIEHDHLTGLSHVYRGNVSVTTVLEHHKEHGITINEYARLMFERSEPNEKEQRKARYQLDRAVEQGKARRDDPKLGGVSGTTPARYYPATYEPLTRS